MICIDITYELSKMNLYTQSTIDFVPQHDLRSRSSSSNSVQFKNHTRNIEHHLAYDSYQNQQQQQQVPLLVKEIANRGCGCVILRFPIHHQDTCACPSSHVSTLPFIYGQINIHTSPPPTQSWSTLKLPVWSYYGLSSITIESSYENSLFMY